MFSLSRAWAVMVKEFVQVTRDRLSSAMIVVMPIIQLLLFGYAINDDPRHLPTAVLDLDQSAFSRAVLGAMESSTYMDIAIVADTQADLDRALSRGEAQFAVVIPADFSRRIVRGEHATLLVEADASDPTATNRALGMVEGLPQHALARELTGALARPQASPPFEVVIHRRYNPESVTAFNIVPGLLGVVLSMTLVMMTALGMARERERGTMESLLSTPVRPLEVMVGKLTPYVAVGALQALMFLLLARLLFQVPMGGGWGVLVLGVMLFIIGALGLGFLISTVARTQLQAMQMSVFYILPSVLLSGFIFPFRAMPDWAQWIGSAIPVTHFLRVVRGALLKSTTFIDAWPSLAALLVFVLAVGALALARYRTTLE